MTGKSLLPMSISIAGAWGKPRGDPTRAASAAAEDNKMAITASTCQQAFGLSEGQLLQQAKGGGGRMSLRDFPEDETRALRVEPPAVLQGRLVYVRCCAHRPSLAQKRHRLRASRPKG